MSGPLWTDTVSAIASGLGVFILAAGALYARKQVEEARQLRFDQSRPFVVVDFEAQSRPPFITLEIKNIGKTLAKEVELSFDPELVSTWDNTDPKISEVGLLKRIASLPPGKTLTVLFDSAIERYPRKDLPATYRVVLTYKGPRPQDEPYRDEQILDLSMYENATYVTVRTVHDVHERLKDIAQEMKKWTTGIRGLLVKTPADVTRENEEFRKLVSERKKAQASSKKRKSGSGTRVTSTRSRKR